MVALCGCVSGYSGQNGDAKCAETYEVVEPATEERFRKNHHRRTIAEEKGPPSYSEKRQAHVVSVRKWQNEMLDNLIASIEESLERIKDNPDAHGKDKVMRFEKARNTAVRARAKIDRELKKAQRRALREIRRAERRAGANGLQFEDVQGTFERASVFITDRISYGTEQIRLVGRIISEK